MSRQTEMESEFQVKKRFELISPYLSEKTKRIWAASEAIALGRGGNTLVSKVTKISRITINKGRKELLDKNNRNYLSEKERSKGGGRKKLTEKDQKLLVSLNLILDPVTRGDPESLLRWTCKSTYQIAEALKKKNHDISQRSVYSILSEQGYSLQSNRKKLEGNQNPDRDAQFQNINKKALEFQKKGQPVISVDTKKKENIGNFANNGKEWEKSGEPTEVNTYDFPDKEKGKANPYGIYDIKNNKGWVNVGISKDTAEFAVESIRRWWKDMGENCYPKAEELLITADGGGSNGYRVRLWKKELQHFSNEAGLKISVCHFPAGTSKWNKIEHRLFSFISKNWRGRPLDSLKTIVNLIASTTTKKGLYVKAVADMNTYEKGIKVSDREIEELNISRDDFHGEWNYSIAPQT